MLDSLLGSFDFLHGAMVGLSARGESIAENLANVDTPHYKRKEVEFESQLQHFRARKAGNSEIEMVATNPKHFGLGPLSIGEVRPISWRSQATATRNDGNNVDIDYEMTLLAQNQLTYNALAELMKRDFDTIKGAIRG